MPKERKLWLRFNDPLAVMLAEMLFAQSRPHVGRLDAIECAQLIPLLPGEVLIESHVPRTSAASQFCGSCRWDDDARSQIADGDIVFLTKDWETYYLIGMPDDIAFLTKGRKTY